MAHQVCDETEVLNEMVRRLVDIIHPDKVILFGSRARAEHRSGSDFDLLVIAESERPRHSRSAELYGVLKDIIVPTDIIVYTPHEVEEWSQVPQAFVTTVVREGRVLYEKHG